MRNPILLLALLLTTCVTAWAEAWRYEDKQGNKIVVEHPGLPADPVLAKAFSATFFPEVEPLLDPEGLVDYEKTVSAGLKTERYQSLWAEGLIVYKNRHGEMMGAHPTKVFETLTWDLKRRQPVPLKALIQPAKLASLYALLKKRAESEDAVDPSWGLNYYLRKDGVVFYQPDAPHVAFGLEFVVPYRELRALAAPGSPLLDPAVSGKL
jgi:hypothetical protein